MENPLLPAGPGWTGVNQPGRPAVKGNPRKTRENKRPQTLERFTEKWNPVFWYEARQKKELEHFSVFDKQ